VKAENAHLSSVCELGAIVGSLWRDLDPTQKQEYNELYAKDKVQYVKLYLQNYYCTCSVHIETRVRTIVPSYYRIGR